MKASKMTKKEKAFYFTTGREIALKMTCPDALAYAKKLFKEADTAGCAHDYDYCMSMAGGIMDAYYDMGFNY